MSEEKKCKCEFCKMSMKMDEVIQRRDPDEMAKLINELADLWANVDFDLSYCKCVLNGDWDSAEEQLMRGLAKVRKHNGKCVLCGGERGDKNESQICYVCKKITESETE